jgi:hypothetical protein
MKNEYSDLEVILLALSNRNTWVNEKDLILILIMNYMKKLDNQHELIDKQKALMQKILKNLKVKMEN